MPASSTAPCVPAPALRALGWLAAAIGVAVALVLVLHVFIRPVSPMQHSPAGHFGGACVACHFVSEGADVVPID